LLDLQSADTEAGGVPFQGFHYFLFFGEALRP
jgi:hypothetical protein